MASPPKDLYAYIPGIIGKSDGNRKVSAGIFMKCDNKTASNPIIVAAIADATIILLLP